MSESIGAPGGPAPTAASDCWVSHSPDETERAGARFAAALRAGDLVALVGPLGAGKTRLVHGIAHGLDFHGAVRSPTFTLVNEYSGRVRLIHVDLYRIEPEEVAGLALEELVERGALIVEWGEKLGPRWLEQALTISIERCEGETRRLDARIEGPPSADAAAPTTARARELLEAWRGATRAARGGGG